MPISLTIELSDQDIQRLSQVAKSATHASDKASIETATAAASKLIDEASRGEVPKFVTERLEKLDRMIAMIRDEGWAMEGDDQQHVLNALAYFVDPNDIIADSTPVIGYLDDALMIEICAIELAPELAAYEEFCDFRQNEAEQRGLDPAKVGRAEWLVERRTELQDRMRKWRTRDYGEGYGDSSGYKSQRSYTGSGWRPSLFRTT